MKLLVIAIALCLATTLAVAESNQGDAVAVKLSAEYLPPIGNADNGHRYKIVRKVKDGRAEPTLEYLPPVVEAPSQEYQQPDAGSVSTKVANDGYRYMTVRKLKFRSRHRRDISEIVPPSNEYLPPPGKIELASVLKTTVGDDDGYRYKTVRRLKYRRRHRRDADGVEVIAADAAQAVAPSNDYLPPPATEAAVAAVKEAAPSAELAKDGYRYKTVRRFRYRHRH